MKEHKTHDDRTKPLLSGFGPNTTAQEVLAGQDLSGKVAIVTGGHGGIGLETTRALAGAGATVIVGARDVNKAQEILAPLGNIEVIGSISRIPLRSMSSRLSSCVPIVRSTF